MPEAYVTLFFGILDRRDGRLVYCNAGHTRPASGARRTATTHALGGELAHRGRVRDRRVRDSEAYLDYGDELGSTPTG